jgi:hypothetical protein
MSESSKTLYVGLDVHKDSIAVAYARDDVDEATEPSLELPQSCVSVKDTLGQLEHRGVTACFRCVVGLLW